MKKFIYFLFLTCLMQFATAQQKGGLYFLSFRLDEDLVTELQFTRNKATVLDQFSMENAFPEELLDSIRLETEKLASEMLNAKVECIYKKNKKGKNLTTTGAIHELEGMPFNTLKNAMENNPHDIFVRVDVQYAARGGIQIDWPWGKKYKLRPVVELRLVANDKSGSEIYSKKVKLKKFPKLRVREHNFEDGDITVKKAEVLYPVDIYDMFLDTVEAFKTSAE